MSETKVETQISEILALPRKIREKMTDIMLMQKRINESEYELRQWKATQIQHISAISDENGKKVFSNEKLRQAELERKKATSQKYRDLHDAREEYSELQEKDKIELEYLRYQFRALETYTRFLQATSETSRWRW